MAAAADDRPAARPDGATEHYFSEAPTVRHRPGHVLVEAAGDRFGLATDAGTFSPRRLDPGTAFLLETAPPPPPHGTFLDLGCGYGPIALSLARRSPRARVVAVDVNARSRELCAANAASLGCDNVEVAAPDEVDPAVRFDLLWSNPPIRVGKDVLHELLSRWLGRLADGGSAVLVVGRNLGADSLQRWLDETGFPAERLASKRGYRLLRASRS
ncbi:MAG TPA: methyltransferase [Acidimicrobiales bacterium]|nr:methyltransferase [Acidimicrobiales bacterium]